MERRGIHVMTGGAATVPALERLVSTLAPSLGLNWVIRRRQKFMGAIEQNKE